MGERRLMIRHWFPSSQPARTGLGKIRFQRGEVAQLVRANGSYPLGQQFKSALRYHFQSRCALQTNQAIQTARNLFDAPLCGTINEIDNYLSDSLSVLLR